MSTGFVVNPVDARDERAHQPPEGAAEPWQESWGLFWYDPHTHSGGYHHAGMQRPRGRADEWNWVAQAGQVVGKYQSLTLPLPGSDLPDLEMPGLRVRSEKPLQSSSVRGQWPGAGADLRCDGFRDAFSYSFASASMGADHYDILSRVTGTVTSEHGTVEVSGWGLQDHSWGERSYDDLHAYRWQWAIFDEDLAFYHVSFLTDRGLGSMGYVHEDGGFEALVAGDVRVTVAADGHSPLSSTTRVRARSGKTWELDGTVDVSSPSSHDDGWLFCTGLTTFRCGGRVGGGLFEMRELTRPVAVLHGTTPDDEPTTPEENEKGPAR